MYWEVHQVVQYQALIGNSYTVALRAVQVLLPEWSLVVRVIKPVQPKEAMV